MPICVCCGRCVNDVCNIFFADNIASQHCINNKQLTSHIGLYVALCQWTRHLRINKTVSLLGFLVLGLIPFKWHSKILEIACLDFMKAERRILVWMESVTIFRILKSCLKTSEGPEILISNGWPYESWGKFAKHFSNGYVNDSATTSVFKNQCSATVIPCFKNSLKLPPIATSKLVPDRLLLGCYTLCKEVVTRWAIWFLLREVHRVSTPCFRESYASVNTQNQTEVG